MKTVYKVYYKEGVESYPVTFSNTSYVKQIFESGACEKVTLYTENGSDICENEIFERA